jgi:hypothetical protein
MDQASSQTSATMVPNPIISTIGHLRFLNDGTDLEDADGIRHFIRA